jgi:Protein of unknown function (DUF2785)
MTRAYWSQVKATGLGVPEDRPLAELTTELTTMLGSPDPHMRDGLAYPTLATWIDRGVYDDLIVGLGDGMAAGLTVGLGEQETDSVFRRAFSVLVLAECIDRDNAQGLVPGLKLLDWGDRIASWYLRERDVRGFVPEKGWAHAVAHGADAIGVLARSPHLGRNELTVLLDVIGDRVLAPVDAPYSHGEPDRMALATMTVLRRNLVPLAVVEPWVARITAGARHDYDGSTDPFLPTVNAEAFLRALHLQLAIAPGPPEIRPDLLLVVMSALRSTNPSYLT